MDLQASVMKWKKVQWTTYRNSDKIGGPALTCGQHSEGASPQDITKQNINNIETQTQS